MQLQLPNYNKVWSLRIIIASEDDYLPWKMNAISATMKKSFMASFSFCRVLSPRPAQLECRVRPPTPAVIMFGNVTPALLQAAIVTW